MSSLLPAEECLLIEMNNQDIAKKMVLLFSQKGGCLILQEVQIDFRHFFRKKYASLHTFGSSNLLILLKTYL